MEHKTINKTCLLCNKDLNGRQRKWCSEKCRRPSEKRKESDKLYTNKARLYRIELIKSRGGKCEICGYGRNYSALCFHHKDSKTKEMSLDAYSIRKYVNNTEKIINELNKCILLCNNCHSEVHNPENRA